MNAKIKVCSKTFVTELQNFIYFRSFRIETEFSLFQKDMLNANRNVKIRDVSIMPREGDEKVLLFRLSSKILYIKYQLLYTS